MVNAIFPGCVVKIGHAIAVGPAPHTPTYGMTGHFCPLPRRVVSGRHRRSLRSNKNCNKIDRCDVRGVRAAKTVVRRTIKLLGKTITQRNSLPLRFCFAELFPSGVGCVPPTPSTACNVKIHTSAKLETIIRNKNEMK